jgi:hypothetical protein
MRGADEKFHLYAGDGTRKAIIALPAPTAGRDLQCDESAENAVFNAETLAGTIDRKKGTLEVVRMNLRT